MFRLQLWMKPTEPCLVTGKHVKVEVLDSATQEGVPMTLGEFAEYYTTETQNQPLDRMQRRKIYNLIDLEVSHTALSDLIDAPLLVNSHTFERFFGPKLPTNFFNIKFQYFWRISISN